MFTTVITSAQTMLMSNSYMMVVPVQQLSLTYLAHNKPILPLRVSEMWDVVVRMWP